MGAHLYECWPARLPDLVGASFACAESGETDVALRRAIIPPQVVSVEPALVASEGGSLVTITGTGFIVGQPAQHQASDQNNRSA